MSFSYTNLRSITIERLQAARSIHKENGFHTPDEVRAFWKLHGAKGFLNIQEITPRMVNEIRTEIIEKN